MEPLLGCPARGRTLFRVGIGYDVHRLVEGRPLILGGVNIPFDKGLEGHSDADVLTHAIIDAVLGALGLGDIGVHFPDSDPAYRGANSLEFLRKVMRLVAKEGLVVNNVDAIVVAQSPKLSPFIWEMRKGLAEAMNTGVSAVNIKATTTEGLGFCGNSEGMASYAVVSLMKDRGGVRSGRKSEWE